MSHFRQWLCGCALLVVFSVSAADPVAQVQSTKGSFADVKERVVMALENRGLVLNYTAHVGDMLHFLHNEKQSPDRFVLQHKSAIAP